MCSRYSVISRVWCHITIDHQIVCLFNEVSRALECYEYNYYVAKGGGKERQQKVLCKLLLTEFRSFSLSELCDFLLTSLSSFGVILELL